MREIKFRVWDKKDKKMRQLINIVFNTGFYLEPNDNTLKLIWVKGYDIIEQKDVQMQREKDFKLMQYTGLKDKNGKEIYEGDIVRFSEVDTAVVEWNEKYSYFTVKPIQNYYFDSDVLGHAIEYSKVEVIGNIHENSNLLKDY